MGIVQQKRFDQVKWSPNKILSFMPSPPDDVKKPGRHFFFPLLFSLSVSWSRSSPLSWTSFLGSYFIVFGNIFRGTKKLTIGYKVSWTFCIIGMCLSFFFKLVRVGE